jgi:hypothetical protein
VVSEQFPKGGALTLNAIGGVGMLAVGVLGFPFIGLLQEKSVAKDLTQEMPQVFTDISKKEDSILGPYRAIVPEKVAALSAEQKRDIERVEQDAKQGALAKMAVFPCIMLVCYLILIGYFRSKGGYKAEVLTGHAAEDEKFTGGVPAPMEA